MPPPVWEFTQSSCAHDPAYSRICRGPRDGTVACLSRSRRAPLKTVRSASDLTPIAQEPPPAMTPHQLASIKYATPPARQPSLPQTLATFVAKTPNQPFPKTTTRTIFSWMRGI
ncbi:hypothetical protein HPP92_015267 [Vanilla planifolia]|uniref:Uncharacterized protein n=1 Tax=Vanilla planifolia TaxID=51239 RepID=A0A835UUX9_VANPL|nr:hypothetical protein HPP92_015267 [Vanilla planifolia]